MICSIVPSAHLCQFCNFCAFTSPPPRPVHQTFPSLWNTPKENVFQPQAWISRGCKPGLLHRFPIFFQISLHMPCQVIVSRSRKELIKLYWCVQDGSALAAETPVWVARNPALQCLSTLRHEVWERGCWRRPLCKEHSAGNLAVCTESHKLSLKTGQLFRIRALYSEETTRTGSLPV